MRINQYFYFYVAIFFCLIGNAQITVSGVIKDSLNNVVPYANVVAYDFSTNNTTSYAYADEKGYYELVINTKSDLRLEFSALSYKTKSIKLAYDISKQKSILNVTLEIKTEVLDNVTINAERPIVVKNDTISIRIDSFTNGTEDVAEDILKKLPGIEVTDDGIVKVQGKIVEKIMVEGDDLFEKGYSLLTKNLNADVIDKVEILKKFTNNKILKGIEDSDKVALNLTLKENRKTSFFGNASLGYGTKNFYENKLNLISFNKKTKYYFFGNINNIGEDPTGDIYQLIYPKIFSEEEYIGDNLVLDDIINLDSDFIDFKKNRTKFNNAELASLNTIYNPNDNLKLKGLAFFTSDETDFFRNSIQEFRFEDQNFTNREGVKLRNKVRSGLGKWDAILSLNETAMLDYTGKYSFTNEVGNNDLQFNSENISENLNNNVKYTNHRLSYTKKIAASKAFQINGRYIYDERPQTFNVDTFLFEDLFPDTTNVDAIQQNLYKKTNYYGIEVKYFSNSKKGNFEANVGFSNRFNHLTSDLIFISTNNSNSTVGGNYSNNFRFTLKDFFLKSKFKYKLSKNINITPEIEIHKLYYDENTISDDAFLILPKVGLSWKLNKNNLLYTFYRYQINNLLFNDLYDNYILTSYRSFTRGVGKFDQLEGDYFLTSYTYGNWSSAFLVNASFIYNKYDNYLSTNRLISPNFSQTSKIILQNRELFSTSITADTFIDLIASNIKLKTGISKNDFNDIVNNSDLREVNSRSFFVGAELRSAFEGIFNFHTGTTWTNTQVKTTITSTNTDNKSFLDFTLKFSDRFLIEVMNERYNFGNLSNGDYYFTDAQMQYQFKSRKIKLKLSLNNIWNTKNFSNFFVGDVSTVTMNYRLIPRYVLLKAEIKF